MYRPRACVCVCVCVSCADVNNRVCYLSSYNRMCNVVNSALYSWISRHPSLKQLKRVLDSVEKATWSNTLESKHTALSTDLNNWQNKKFLKSGTRTSSQLCFIRLRIPFRFSDSSTCTPLLRNWCLVACTRLSIPVLLRFYCFCTTYSLCTLQAFCAFCVKCICTLWRLSSLT